MVRKTKKEKDREEILKREKKREEILRSWLSWICVLFSSIIAITEFFIFDNFDKSLSILIFFIVLISNLFLNRPPKESSLSSEIKGEYLFSKLSVTTDLASKSKFKIPFMIIFCMLSILGVIPVILLWNMEGEFYRWPHWWLNTIFFMPFISCLVLYYIRKLESIEQIREIRRKYNKILICIALLLFQAIIPWGYSFFLLYVKEPTHLANIFITAQQTMCFVIIGVWGFYYLFLFIYAIICKMEVQELRGIITLEDIWPIRVLQLFPAYFVIWGIAAFYPHANRLEINFYLGIVVYEVLTIVILIATWKTFPPEKEVEYKKRVVKNIELLALGLVLAFGYCIFIGVLETYDTPLTSPVLYHELQPGNSLLLIGIEINFMVIILVFVASLVLGLKESFLYSHDESKSNNTING